MAGRPDPDHRGRLELRPRRAPAGPRRLQRHAGRHPEAGRDDPRGGGPLSRGLRRHPQRPPAAVRALRVLGRGAAQFSAEPARRHRAGDEERGEHGGPGQARPRQSPRTADLRPLLLLAARDRARDPPRRLLVGRADARHPPAAPGEDGPVLARALRHRPEQGARLPQDARSRSTRSSGTPPATSASCWWRWPGTRACSTTSTPG